MTSVNGDTVIPLPLVPEVTKREKTDQVSYDLFSDPADNTSAKYKYTMYRLTDQATIREAIAFVRNTARVTNGLAITTAAGKKQIIDKMMAGTHAAAFNTAWDAQHEIEWENAKVAARAASATAGESMAQQQAAYDNAAKPNASAEMLRLGTVALLREVAPAHALVRQKRYLRRKCRKPADMTIRKFYNYLHKINTEELLWLPPCEPTQRLPDDEIVDILCAATPSSWNKELTRQGKDPSTMTAIQVVHFFEDQEATEDFNGSAKPAAKKQGKKQKTSSSKSDQDNDCLYHGPNTHPTSVCKVVKSMIASAKGDSKQGGETKPSWKKKAFEAKRKAKRDLNAYIKQAVQKQLNNVEETLDEGKRKAASDDSDDDGSLNLAEFNYNDMEDLKIDSDDEVSV